MKKLRTVLAAMIITLGFGGIALVPAQTSLAGTINPGNSAQDGVTAAGGGNGGEGQLRSAIRTVINILLFIIGAVAVIMIVIGGIKYTVSNGDSNQITSAKNTILYAVVGLVVALLAYAIVNFVLDQF